MDVKKIGMAIVSFALCIAGAAVAAGKLLGGDGLSVFWLVEFVLGLWVTALHLHGKSAHGRYWNFLDVLLFVVGLGLFLLFSRYRLMGLLLLVGFPFRQMLGRDGTEESEQTEQKSRFDEHIRR